MTMNLDCGKWRDANLPSIFCGALNISRTDHHQQEQLQESIRLTFHVTPEASKSQEQRDLIRRAVDTAVAALHPPIDPAHVSVAIASDDSAAVVVSFDVSLAAAAASAALLYSTAGRVFAHSTTTDPALVTLVESDARALMKAQRKRQKALFPSSAALQGAMDVVRLVYPQRGNPEVTLEPSGVELVCAVVGKCARYVYLAVGADDDEEKPHQHRKLVVVGRAPHGGATDHLFAAAAAAAPSHKQQQQPPSWIRMHFAIAVTLPAEGGVTWILSEDAIKKVRVVAYRMVKEKTGDDVTQLEDCHILQVLSAVGAVHSDADGDSDGDDGDALNTYSELTDTVAALRQQVSEKMVKVKSGGTQNPGLASSEAKTLLRRLCDPKYVFAPPQDRRRFAAQQAALSALFASVTGMPASGGALRVVPPGQRRLAQPDETQRVEFKGAVHAYDEARDRGGSKANIERVRRVLAAFANTRGGLLLVGVSDAGDLVGVPASTEVPLPRTTGFLPAMVNNAVSSVKLQLQLQLGSSGGAAAAAAGGASPSGIRTDWWKSADGAGDASTVAQDQQQQQQLQQNQQQRTEKKLVHVVQVLPGTAPFYATPGLAAPPVRGQASTLSLSVAAMVERVARELTKMGEQHHHHHHHQQQQQQQQQSQEPKESGKRRERDD